MNLPHMKKHCVKVSILLCLVHSHQLHSPTDAQLLQNDCNQLYKIIITIYVKNLHITKQHFSSRSFVTGFATPCSTFT